MFLELRVSNLLIKPVQSNAFNCNQLNEKTWSISIKLTSLFPIKIINHIPALSYVKNYKLLINSINNALNFAIKIRKIIKLTHVPQHLILMKSITNKPALKTTPKQKKSLLMIWVWLNHIKNPRTLFCVRMWEFLSIKLLWM